MTLTVFVTRLLASMVAGGLIGLERQRSRKSAGIRTNTLVAIGACTYVLVSVNLSPMEGTDPSRIISQIITGIGFLGAGVILQYKGSIRGLTTAATVWCSAGLGVLGGLGMFWELAICTVAIWFVNTFLKTDKYMKERRRNKGIPHTKPEDEDTEHEDIEYAEDHDISDNDDIID